MLKLVACVKDLTFNETKHLILQTVKTLYVYSLTARGFLKHGNGWGEGEMIGFFLYQSPQGPSQARSPTWRGCAWVVQGPGNLIQ